MYTYTTFTNAKTAAQLLRSRQVKEDALATLIAARARIERRGKWCKASTGTTKGRVCAIGAISVARDPNQGYFVQSPSKTDPAIAALCIEISDGKSTYPKLGTVTDFNDNPKNKHADVLAKFDGAIARLQAQLNK